MDLKGPENYDRLLLIIENKYPKFLLKYCRFEPFKQNDKIVSC